MLMLAVVSDEGGSSLTTELLGVEETIFDDEDPFGLFMTLRWRTALYLTLILELNRAEHSSGGTEALLLRTFDRGLSCFANETKSINIYYISNLAHSSRPVNLVENV